MGCGGLNAQIIDNDRRLALQPSHSSDHNVGLECGIRHVLADRYPSSRHDTFSTSPDRGYRRPARARRVVGMSIVAGHSPVTMPTDSLLEIYLERRANLVRFFAARTGSVSRGEDLAQELYIKLASRDLSAITVENPVALIYRVATNVMLDHARGDARTVARDAAWRRLSHVSVGGVDIAIEPAADDAAASRQRLRQLVDAVAELPPQMQRAFRLHKLEGRSHAETARVMGLSVKSVEKHISAALKSLTLRLV